MENKKFFCQVGFEDFIFDCIIGVYPEERDIPQPISVSVYCTYDANQTAADDQVEGAVDYAQMSQQIMEVAQEGEFKLLEALGQAIVQNITENWPQVQSGRLEIRKPRALSRARASVLITEF
jgi:dihydroneopterin aldolase